MSIFYSKYTGGFYSEDFHGRRTITRYQYKDTTDKESGEVTRELVKSWEEPNPDCLIPHDAVEITDSHHKELLAMQSVGQIIVSDEEGNPINAAPPPPSTEQLVAALKLDALTALGASDITILRCYEAGIPVPVEWVAYRDHLRGIVKGTEQPTALPTKPAFPETK